MLLTFGPFLDRAQEQSFPVSVLVSEHWIVGEVVTRDGRGVILLTADGEMALIKMEAITAVKSTATNLAVVPEQEAV